MPVRFKDRNKSHEKLLPDEVIMNKIYEVRETKVMIDRDLAELYGVETKVLKQAVKRNIEMFPEDFMFEMSKHEFTNWRSQFVTSKSDKKGLRYAPFCFTEQGVAMLSSVLKSKQAISLNIAIMRTFVKLRKVIQNNYEIKRRLDEHDDKIVMIIKAINNLIKDKNKLKNRNPIGYKQNKK